MRLYINRTCFIGNNVSIGPYCHLREGSKIADGVSLGNYVEIKQSTIGKNTRIGHFTYIGDSIVGGQVNIGAGTVTANYDGQEKHQTVIEDGSFIGVNSVLIARDALGVKPLYYSKGEKHFAFSSEIKSLVHLLPETKKLDLEAVVTKDVPPDSLVVGIPGRIRPGKGE